MMIACSLTCRRIALTRRRMCHGQVILMDSSISAYSAYSLMAANEQQSVPVWDSRADRYCGTLTTTDLVQLILLCSDSKEHESCKQGMRDLDLDHFINNYSRPPWGDQVFHQSSILLLLLLLLPLRVLRIVRIIPLRILLLILLLQLLSTTTTTVYYLQQRLPTINTHYS